MSARDGPRLEWVMLFLRPRLFRTLLLLLALFGSSVLAQQGTVQTQGLNSAPPLRPSLAEDGQALFLQHCAFCHGRDAGGGETGPDLTSSKLVGEDVKGDKISVVVKNGRPQNGMPRFNLSDGQIAALAAFIHQEKDKSDAHPGRRRGVEVSDLQTGNADAGKQYFNGAGGCSGCHSPTGDLAGLARRLQGLKLEERLLYPANAEAKLTVTLPSGETMTGKLAYKDEFTVGLMDASGWYRSWPVDAVKFIIDDPAEAHAKLLEKYTDDDVHNLMAYLQTLR